MTVKLLHTTMPGLGGMFSVRNLLSLYEMSDLHHFHTGEMESLSTMHFY